MHDDKILVVATQGEEHPELAKFQTDYGKFVGKVIISDLEIKDNRIEIKNSKVFNPFNCNHHHHINDLCEFGNNVYLSSFSFCDSDVIMENGAITKLNFSGKPDIIANNLDKPHSLKYFKHALYVTSSGSSSIFSINSGEKNLEYKGPDVFVRGLVVTESYLYLGASLGIGKNKFQVYQ